MTYKIKLKITILPQEQAKESYFVWPPLEAVLPISTFFYDLKVVGRVCFSFTRCLWSFYLKTILSSIKQQ